jgi:RNA polymerase sigma factor (sigma-70 family)
MSSLSSSTAENHVWEQERIRLVALCTRLTGSFMVAEDLAQEALYEAWRHRERLHDPTRLSSWLAAIARNVYLRWRAQQGRDTAYQLVSDVLDRSDILADPFDLEASVEQPEIWQLLERALALLPATTRQAFLEHCLLGAPFAAIAARQGLAEAAVKMQVHRGKLRLRHLLTTTFAEEAANCGLIARSDAQWSPTMLWCPRCGQRHLEGRWNFAEGSFMLRCRDCLSTSGIYSAYESVPALFQGVTSLKAGFNRVMRWVNATYQPAIEQGGTLCDCGRFLPLVLHLPDEKPDGYREVTSERYRQIRGLHLHCSTCNGTNTMHLANLALYHPVAWRFWGEHRRIRMLPEREITFQERPALFLPFQSIADDARLDVIVARDTYAILNIQPGAPPF